MSDATTGCNQKILIFFNNNNNLNDQLDHIRQFVAEKSTVREGMKLPSQRQEVSRVIELIDNIWLRDMNDRELKRLLWTYCALMHSVIAEMDNSEVLVGSFCEKIGDPSISRYAQTRVDILRDFLLSMHGNDRHDYRILKNLLSLARAQKCVLLWPAHARKPVNQINELKLPEASIRELLGLLDEVYVNSNDNEAAFEVCQQLLHRLKKDENSEFAKQVVLKCISRAVRQPKLYLLDHLLLMDPVKEIEGEPAHQLLSIFVSGDLKGYLKWYNNFKDRFDEFQLDHEVNIEKMRLLTFVQLADKMREIAFETLTQELMLEDAEIEMFVINAIKSELLSCLIDLVNRKVIVNRVAQRTFTRMHWRTILQDLKYWKQCLDGFCARYGRQEA